MGIVGALHALCEKQTPLCNYAFDIQIDNRHVSEISNLLLFDTLNDVEKNNLQKTLPCRL
jgi:hypothetical protein